MGTALVELANFIREIFKKKVPDQTKHPIILLKVWYWHEKMCMCTEKEVFFQFKVKVKDYENFPLNRCA